MSAKQKLGAASAIALVVAVWLYACVSSGSGSDFDDDGLTDATEDRDDNFAYDPGEADFLITDTDSDRLCDGQPDPQQPTCTGCEDCNNNGFWEPCLGETDPLNDDTDNDGIPDADDPAPLDNLAIDCSQGSVQLEYGASLPPGKPFPVAPPPTLTPAPFPTSTTGPAPTPIATPTP